MGARLVVQARENWDDLDIRLVGMPSRVLHTWKMLLLFADDETGIYDRGWDLLRWQTATAVGGQASERSVARAMQYLREAGLVEPLPRTPGENRAYLLHP